MTWITTVPEADATGELGEAYAHIHQQNGTVSNITQAVGINARVMQALANLLYALRGPHCALGKRRQEMIAVASPPRRGGGEIVDSGARMDGGTARARHRPAGRPRGVDRGWRPPSRRPVRRLRRRSRANH